MGINLLIFTFPRSTDSLRACCTVTVWDIVVAFINAINMRAQQTRV